LTNKYLPRTTNDVILPTTSFSFDWLSDFVGATIACLTADDDDDDVDGGEATHAAVLVSLLLHSEADRSDRMAHLLIKVMLRRLG